MVYDCDSWLAFPWCWIWFGQVQTVLQMMSVAVLGWASWTIAREMR